MWLQIALGTLALAYTSLCLFYYVFQERFIFVRFRTRRSHTYRFEEPCTEVWLDRPDGARLHALRFHSANTSGTVLYFHGNTGNLKRWGRRAARFTQLGYDVLMPDPRGYGKSKGRTSEAALIGDAIAWYDHVRTGSPGSAVILYGCSLGCALAIPVAAERQPRSLLLETPFANLTDVARSYLPILPYRWLLRYPFRNDVAIQRVNCPVYIFHGKRDHVVPYASALRLYAAVPSNVQRQLFTFPRGEHHDLYRFEEFKQVLRKLLTA